MAGKKNESLNNLNRSIYKNGLSPAQYGLAVIGVIISWFLHPLVALGLLVTIIVLFKKVAEANNNGNPDYLGSLFRNFGRKKYYEDAHNSFKYLIDEK